MTDESSGGSESPLQSILHGAKWVFGGRIVKMAVVFLAQIIVARFLGTSFYGGLAQANAVAGVASLVGALGVGTGVSRQLAYYEDDPEQARGIIRAGFAIGLVGTTAVAIGLYVAAPYLATEVFGDETLILLFRIVSVGIPLGILGNLGVSMAKASRDASTHTYINQFLRPLTNSAFRIGAAVLGFGAVGVVTGNVIAKAITSIVALVLAVRVFPFSVFGASKRMYRNLFTFSLPLLLAGGFNFLIGDIDTFLLGAFETSAAVGLYTAVFNLRPMVLVFFFPATYLLGPVLTRLQKEERPDDARRTYTAISKWTTIVTLPLFLLPFLFPSVVIGVSYGSEYVDPTATPVLRIFALSMLINVALGANDRAVVALGHNKVTMYVAAVAATTNFVLNLALIPRFGLLGAGVASALAFASRDVINTILLYRWHGLSPVSPSIIKILLVMAALVPVGYFGFVSVMPVNFFTVTAVGLVFIVLYVPIALRLGIEGQVDYEIFNKIEESSGFNLSAVRRGIRWITSI